MCRTDQLVLHSDRGEVKTINLFNGKLQNMTVKQVKTTALKEFPHYAGLKPDRLKLIVVDKPLDNDSASLSDYGIKQMAHVQMVRKVDGG